MDFKQFSQNLANEIKGEYTEYDSRHSVFIVPLPEERFQTVVARIHYHEKYKRDVIQVLSKVCEINGKIDFPALLEASAELVYTKFIAEDGYLKTEGTFFLENVTDALIKEMILEVTYTADDWELKITGKDRF